ncbi:MAG: hypothetical protein P4L50_07440 [Anaerolineaceae bacterium]|nr:hypothetical protein [Anaerolineaceae bacterium]
MMTTFTLKLILGLAVLLSLSGCQSFSGLLGETAKPTALPPLSGPRASVLGESALAFQQSTDTGGVFLTPILAGTGKVVSGYQALDIGQNYDYAFSPNREQLAIVSLGARDCSSICLHVLDLRTWKYSIPAVDLSKDSSAFFSNLVFDPQGKKLAMVYDNGNNLSQIVLLDLVQGKVTARSDINYSPFMDAFTPNGSLAVWGSFQQSQQDTIGHVALLDGNNLTVQWQQDLPQVSYGNDIMTESNDPTIGRYLSPATAFAPDASRLYIVLADTPRLLTIDFTQPSVSSLAIEPRRSLIGRLLDSTAGVAYAKALNGTIKTGLLSADGKELFVLGQTSKAVKDKDGNLTSISTPLGLQVIDVNSGALVSGLSTPATDMALSPDGTMLFLYSWTQYNDVLSIPSTEIIDVKKLAVASTLPGQYTPTRLLDGKIGWLYENPQIDNTDRLAIYDPSGSKLRNTWSEPNTNTMFWLAVP